jgi:hypothetical protein
MKVRDSCVVWRRDGGRVVVKRMLLPVVEGERARVMMRGVRVSCQIWRRSSGGRKGKRVNDVEGVFGQDMFEFEIEEMVVKRLVKVAV